MGDSIFGVLLVFKGKKLYSVNALISAIPTTYKSRGDINNAKYLTLTTFQLRYNESTNSFDHRS